MAALIAPAAAADQRKAYDDAAHDEAVAALAQFARHRSAEVLRQVGEARTLVDRVVEMNP